MSGHFSALLAQSDTDTDRLPLTLLTGFLGSGKTTLLNRVLSQPEMAGTAVIVNEFGEVGIDHDLITASTDDVVLLPNGCLCCAMRGDLADAVARAAASGPRRILLETSGLADPAPILRSLLGDPAIRARAGLTAVVCVIDAAAGATNLARHPEARAQLALADHVLVTKTDLADPEALVAQARQANAHADIHVGPRDAMTALCALAGTAPQAAAAAPYFYRPVTGAPGTAEHRDGITTQVLVRDTPLPRAAFARWLDMVIALRGDALLRVKGLVHLDDAPDSPWLIQGVQHHFAPPEALPAWPSNDRRTRIVFIAQGLDLSALEQTLDVLTQRRARSP